MTERTFGVLFAGTIFETFSLVIDKLKASIFGNNWFLQLTYNVSNEVSPDFRFSVDFALLATRKIHILFCSQQLSWLNMLEC